MIRCYSRVALLVLIGLVYVWILSPSTCVDARTHSPSSSRIVSAACTASTTLSSRRSGSSVETNMEKYAGFTPPACLVIRDRVVPVSEGGAATLRIWDDNRENGWIRFEAEHLESASSVWDDTTLAYAIGLVEGAATSDAIAAHWKNMNGLFFPKGTSEKKRQQVYAFLEENLRYVVEKMLSPANARDPFWREASHIWNQVRGLVDGYNQSRKPQDPVLNLMDMYFLASVGDVDDIASHFQTPQTLHRDYESFLRLSHERTHCSAFIKVVDGDVVFGHNSWLWYSYMVRVYKRIRFRYSSYPDTGVLVAFSSYPASIASIDDFYLTSRSMLVMETTNLIYDDSLYQRVTNQSVLTWMRASIAVRLAVDSRTFVSLISRENSATYNNMWMAFDAKRWKNAGPSAPDTLLIVEQTPFGFHANDVSSYLLNSFWRSFNRPYDPKTFVEMGYPLCEKEFGQWCTWTSTPRALIMDREIGKVKDIFSAGDLITLNDYSHDPISSGNPVNAICARSDLVVGTPKNPDLVFRPHGCIDGKVSSASYLLSGNATARIISGPTHAQQKPFSWNQDPRFTAVVHEGQPEVFDFDWIEV